MSVLLDTHAFLWYVLDDPQLSATARAAIEGESTNILANPTVAATSGNDPRVFVSPASYWEIAIKITIGKYILNSPYETFWRNGIEKNGFEILPIEVRHTAALLNLPLRHKDPFDRLLIAQAVSEGFSIVSSDKDFDQYSVKRVW